ncbi:type I-C CRISPR-associated protein Cas8c/Csd1 [Magnetospirillum aberrantis]|uniref:Type I-C CRISPR-associated protein Cas8c/Csd1 n=1 Tax=Magnetospirillum aberrantis SpK TaxID=908842 RepID=A0A7C9QSG8_9PROT|nr:type I-C CRISPR-associated protein Cas8c/Csd1 [Magnetospirillum aberrantis SpK]
MILAALEQLYHRLAEADPDGTPRLGWNRRSVHFALVLNGDGSVARLADLRDRTGKKPFPKEMLVPDHGEVRTSAAKTQPYFLCDGTAFLLGANAKTGDKALEYMAHARVLHKRLLTGCDEPLATAILAHFTRWSPESAADLCAKHGLDWEKEVSGTNLVFGLEGTPDWAHQRPALVALWDAEFARRPAAAQGQCLVTGEQAPVARLHMGIKLPGTQGNGAPVISFNADAFTSYGHDQGQNAPVGEGAAFRYAAALNTLVKPGSRHRLNLGDTVLAFWAEKPQDDEEDVVAALLGLDDSDGGLDENLRDRVEKILTSIRRGVTPRDSLGNLPLESRYFVLGVAAPGGSRVSLRYWLQSNLGELVGRVAAHQSALHVEKRFPDKTLDSEPTFPGMRALLRAVAPLGKDENIPGPLPGTLARAVLTGTAYPRPLLSMALERMRSEHGPYDSVSYLRIALVKACLFRSDAWRPPVSLNTDETDTAYRLGRLFAALERAQQLALGTGLNATIKDRYFGAASASPGAVFPNLIRLAQHHLSKADAGWLDKMIGDIADALPITLPAMLTLEEQGRFAIGYYHQRNDLWRSKKTPDQPTNPEQ